MGRAIQATVSLGGPTSATCAAALQRWRPDAFSWARSILSGRALAPNLGPLRIPILSGPGKRRRALNNRMRTTARRDHQRTLRCKARDGTVAVDFPRLTACNEFC